MPQHGPNRPRRGSMGYWPRKRARRIYPRIKRWPKINDNIPVAFAGYKVGMTHVFVKDNKKNSPTFGEEVATPATVIEVPPLYVFGIRLYKKVEHYGHKSLTEVWFADGISDKIKRRIKTFNPKDTEEKIKKIEDELLEKASLVKLVVSTQPWLAGIGKKTPEVFEIPVGGDVNSAWEFAKSKLGNTIDITEVFSEGEYIDVIAVTKGKGFQGEVKRFGVKIYPRPHKHDKRARGTQSKGAWGYHRILPTTPMPGQMGFHRRTEYNKLILKISDNPDEINPASGWPHYGIVRSKYVLLKGSVPGAIKRLVILRKAIRPKIEKQEVQLTYISNHPKN